MGYELQMNDNLMTFQSRSAKVGGLANMHKSFLKYYNILCTFAFCFCLGVSSPFASNTPSNWINREGLGKRLGNDCSRFARKRGCCVGEAGGSVITLPSLAVIVMSAQFTKVSCCFPTAQVPPESWPHFQWCTITASRSDYMLDHWTVVSWWWS